MTRDIQRPAAEHRFAGELETLARWDNHPRPDGWLLSPAAIVHFVLGNSELDIQPKFVGSRRFVERCIIALATQRGLMLIGEPGTAKSYLSELLAAAICGDSTLTIQGSAGTTEDDIKYSWNYALLLSDGPSEKALVPSPIHTGMNLGKIVRFEEITRCPLEIQDTLLSVMSDRVMLVPEFKDHHRTLFARTGFNIIATANTRDRGVNEMSVALKRRFNFETVHPIQDPQTEKELVQRETHALLDHARIPVNLDSELTEVLVTAFQELRNGKTQGGKALQPLSTIMSTAEAVSVAFAAGLHAHYFSHTSITPEHILDNLVSTAIKENPEDIKKLAHYFRYTIKDRTSPHWRALYQATKHHHDLGRANPDE